MKVQKNMKKSDIENCLCFLFDYNNFKTYNVSSPVNEWTAYTYGERIKKLYKDGRWLRSEVLNLTENLIKLMEQYNIEYKDGHDIREDISHMDETRNADFICSLFRRIKVYSSAKK